jgi:hypothetical protein
MKKLLFFICILGIFACKKNSAPVIKIDERDSVTGNYSGIWIYTNLDNYPPYDTFPIDVKLYKSETDSLIILCPYKKCYDGDPGYTFKYHNYSFSSITNIHPPRLKYRDDSIFYHWQAGLGPSWDDYLCKRIK